MYVIVLHSYSLSSITLLFCFYWFHSFPPKAFRVFVFIPSLSPSHTKGIFIKSSCKSSFSRSYFKDKCFAHVYACAQCTTCMTSVCGGHKRALDPFELELRTVVSHYEGSGNWTLALCRSSVVKPWTIFPEHEGSSFTQSNTSSIFLSNSFSKQSIPVSYLPVVI